ncbi:MAG: hypothetical protein JXR60_07725 [Bacteroidales bacterium]|nr:hypothetical protein [Bacteroidales bacterium]
MQKEEIKYVLNLFASDVIKEIEQAMKKADCNQCAKGYFDSGMIVKKRLELFLQRLEEKL